jgi:hypothetical protein
VAVPCAGHRHPGPAARRGGNDAMAVAGETAARRVPAHEWHGGRKGRVVLRLGYGGFLGGARHHAGSRGTRNGRRRCGSPAGLKKKALGVAERRGRRVEAVQGARLHRCRCTGAGAVMLRGWRRRPPPRALLLLLLLSSLFLSCGDGRMEKRHGWLGFRSAARVLIRGAGARVRLRPGLFGVRAGTRGGITARRERG